MTGKKSSQPPNSRNGQNVSTKSGPRVTSVHGPQSSRGSAQSQAQKGTTPATRILPLRPSNENCFDVNRISQWAAQSATGAANHDTLGVRGHGNTGSVEYPSHYTNDHTTNQMSIDGSADLAVPYVPYSAGSSFGVADLVGSLPQNPNIGYHTGLPDGGYNAGLILNTNCQEYPTNASNEFFDYNSMDPNFPMVEESFGNNTCSNWDIPDTNPCATSQSLEWSPDVTFTPSSSLQSSHGFLGHQPDTPVSTGTYDGGFQAGSQCSMEGDFDMVPPLTLGEDMILPSYIGELDNERFGSNYFATYLS